MDEKKRQITKSISWQIVEAIGVLLIALLVTRNVLYAFLIALLSVVVKALLYYFHENWWTKVAQRNKKLLDATDYQI